VNGNNRAVVLDSNAVIDILKDREKFLLLDQKFPEAAFCISVITQIEILGYPSITPETENQILDFLKDITIVNLDDIIVEAAIAIRRTKMVKLPDAIIAATALALKASLVTRDSDLIKLQNDSLQTTGID
jgi:predicted nucleic acid-binding protein